MKQPIGTSAISTPSKLSKYGIQSAFFSTGVQAIAIAGRAVTGGLENTLRVEEREYKTNVKTTAITDIGKVYRSFESRIHAS
jgi:hypothetical protein